MNNNQSTPPVWLLRNLESGEKSVVFGNKSLEAILNFMPADQKAHWAISQVGSDTEIPAGDFVLPTAPVPAPTVEVKEALSGEERREHNRREIKLKTLILSGNEVFRTYTENISLGGLLLESSAPAHFLKSPCKIILQSPDHNENIELSFSFVGRLDQTRLHHVHFENNSDEFLRKLQSWLVIHDSDRAA